MAQMIPPIPEDFNGSAGEKRIFRVLRALPDDVIVLHSLRWVHSGNQSTSSRRSKPQGESDFVVIDPKHGILVIEVKGGKICCELGQWYQLNRYSGYEHKIWPEAQASRTKFRIIEELNAKIADDKRVLVCHAVWFPDEEIADRAQLPMNYHNDMTFDSSHLPQPQQAIEKAFAYWKKHIPSTKPPGDLTKKIKSVLCPTLSIVRSVRQTMEEREEAMIQLTEQQARVVEFLDEQFEAAIVGPAGTGKTLLAVEKARRLASPTEPVLFLCYNAALNEHLSKNHKQPNVSYRNFHGLAREIAGPHGSLDEAVKELVQCLGDRASLPYSHVVIDEAQDFEKDWLELLQMHFEDGAFYVFYDPFQAVQNDRNTDWLDSIPCRLSLTKNCRNTDSIAKFAYRAAGLKNRTSLGLDGPKPTLYPLDDDSEVFALVSDLIKSSINDDKIPAHEIAVLTLESLSESQWSAETLGGVATSEKPQSNHVTVNTVRRFKGLEAKVVIIVDVDFTKANNQEWRTCSTLHRLVPDTLCMSSQLQKSLN